jgi:polyhydroxyalkanoate synthesis repressor PhaR
MLDNHPKVLIKRYAGHRLYNTETSTYVTLDDLATMLMSGRRFIVQEADTGEDVTGDILDRLH